MNWTFDWNEWFMIITSCVGFFLILMLRKYFQKIVFMAIWIYSITYIETVDYAFAGSPFNAYYCADNMTYEPVAALIHVFLYLAFSFIFLYFYNKWMLRGRNLVIYIIVWTIFAIIFEWLNVINGVFTYTGWKLYYSIPVYPISCYLLIAVFRFVKRQLLVPIPK